MLHEHELNARAALVKVHDPTSAFPAVTRGLLSIPVSSIPEGYEDMLQKRITALEDEARALKNRKNALVPINRLPHEILSTIFQTTKSLLKYTYPQPRNRLTWVRVSHVCRYWREVALDAASLWSYLDFPRPDPEFTRLMLQRSKNAPLTVDHRGKVASFQQEAVREALSEPHRLRSAYLSITGNSIPFVLSKSQGPAPLLETLRISDITNSSATFPEGFLETGAPSMKDLDLAGFDFVSSWDKLPFVAGLVRLRLNSPSKLKLPQTKAFVRALQQLPLLERLDLRNILPVAGYKKTSPPAAQDTLFSFPKLRCLTLRESSNAVNDFLEVSCFPRCTYILLVLPDNPITPESIRRTLANIAAVAIPKRNSPHAFEHPSHLRDIHLNNRESTQSSRRFLYIGFIFNRHIFGAEKSDLTVDLGACLPFNIGEFLSLAHSHLDFSTLRLIELASCERLLPNKVWLASFSRLKSLNTISFNGSEFLGLLDMLVDDPALPKTMGAGGSGLAMTPYFPSLHIIAFTTVSFKTGRQSSGGDRRRPAFKRLMEYLKRRPPSWPTLTLRIEECSNFGKADYDRVSALGSKVQIEWDEQQYISSDVAEDSGDDE